MGTGTKVALVLAAVAIGIAALFLWEDSRLGAMTAEAQATVTGVRFDQDPESSSLDSTAIDYRYEAAGAAREGSDSLPGDKTADYPPGKAVAICYDPDEPGSSALKRGAACGS